MVDKMDTGFWVGIPENILTGHGEQESPESFFPHFIKVGEYMRVRCDIEITPPVHPSHHTFPVS